MISVILLAAGESKRMGQPKLLLPLGKTTILEQTVDNYLNSEASEVIVVAGSGVEEITRLLSCRPVKVVVNPAYRQGMSTSIITGLNSIDDSARAVMLALADQPLIDSRIIDHLIQEFNNHNKGISIPTHHGRRGHPVIFSIRYQEELLRLKGDMGGRQIIRTHSDDVLEVAIDSESITVDIDNISDYQSLLNKTRH
ncbi:NTP transferase domain-containing protein [Chloroflexota bacterium]